MHNLHSMTFWFEVMLPLAALQHQVKQARCHPSGSPSSLVFSGLEWEHSEISGHGEGSHLRHAVHTRSLSNGVVITAGSWRLEMPLGMIEGEAQSTSVDETAEEERT